MTGVQTCALPIWTKQGDGCGYAAPVEWPKDAAAITTELGNRPIDQDRNWAPAGHRQAANSKTPSGRIVSDAYPRGQTVADLRAENRELEMMPPPASDPEDVLVRANAILAEMGMELDPDDFNKLRRI